MDSEHFKVIVRKPNNITKMWPVGFDGKIVRVSVLSEDDPEFSKGFHYKAEAINLPIYLCREWCTKVFTLEDFDELKEDTIYIIEEYSGSFLHIGDRVFYRNGKFWAEENYMEYKKNINPVAGWVRIGAVSSSHERIGNVCPNCGVTGEWIAMAIKCPQCWKILG